MASRNFATYFWPKFDAHKENDAFIFIDGKQKIQSEKYWNWTRNVRNTAIGFLERDYEIGLRIAICTQDRHAFFEVAFAAWLIGACVVPIPTGRDRKETLKRLARCGASAVILDDAAQYRELVEDSTNIPPLDWIVLEEDTIAPLSSLTEIREKGKFRSKRGALDTLAERTFNIDGNSPALILNAFGSDIYASHFSNAKLSLMMEYLGKSIDWSTERIALQLDLSWLYGILLGTYSLIHGACLVSGKTIRETEEELEKFEPTLLVAGPAYLFQKTESWRTNNKGIQKILGELAITNEPKNTTHWIQTIGTNITAAKLKNSVTQSFGKQLKFIYVVDHPSPDNISEILKLNGIQVSAMWGQPEIGISHIEITPQKGSVGRPVYGYACKTVGTKLDDIGEIAVRCDAMQDGYWGKEGPAEVGKTWIKFPHLGRIVSGDLFLEKSISFEETLSNDMEP